ncbi:MAG: LamG-like jellyroll fold domain-containing protein [Candidatus Aenigmatarchaeota archaeon]
MRKFPAFLLAFLVSLIFFISESGAYDFAIINTTNVPEVNNIYEMFKNLGITYKSFSPSQVTSESVFSDVNGIVSFIDEGFPVANSSTVIEFAKNHVVICHAYDFANYYFPSYSTSYLKVSGSTVNYTKDWGNFRKNDKAHFQREDGTLYVFLSSSLEGDPTIEKIAQFDATRTAFFQKKGLTENTGFYVLDLKVTRNETEWSGIWHIFPAVKLVKNFPTGKYAMWMSNGVYWWDINWVNTFTDSLATNNPEIVSKIVIGKSLEGRDISAILIGKGNRYVIIDGAIHGNEKLSTFASLRFAEMIIENYKARGYWYDRLQELKVIIVPILNPDGFVHNWRQNARSYLYPSDYQKSGYAMAVNDQWIAHGIPNRAEVEGHKCNIVPQDSNVNGTVLSVNQTHFKVGLTWKSDGSPVTTPTNISWSCNATCCNLNRDFPPGADASEPETKALINLAANYTPIIYINGHEGAYYEYNKYYYASNLKEPYMGFAKRATSFAKTIFTNLKHWGYYTDGGTNYFLGRVDTGACCNNVFATYYVTWKHNASSYLVETIVWSSTYGARQQLYGFDYYLSFFDGVISHLDILKEKNFVIHSTAKIKSFNYDNQLIVMLDTSEAILPTQTVIFLGNYGKPNSVKIDGIEKSEGDGWVYYTDSNNITITGASNSIVLGWEPTYTATFYQTGIPSGTPWGVTVASNRYTSTASSLTVSGLTGTVSYSYDTIVPGVSGTRYSCVSDCSGYVSQEYNTTSANYITQYFLAMSVNPVGSGNVAPGNGWYNSSMSITISASPNPGYGFSSWNGSGSGSYTGIENPASITMNSPITEIANFVPFSDVIGYWKFDEGSGYEAKDSSVYKNNGIVNASWSLTNCLSIYCLNFDGIDDVINCSNSSILNPTPTGSITVEAWIYPRSYGGNGLGRVVSKETGTTANPYALELRNTTEAYTNGLIFCIGNGTSETCTIGSACNNIITLNTWQHVAGRYNRTHLSVFVNGVEKCTQSLLDYNFQPASTNLLIGNNPSNERQFNGAIDEVRIWNRALSNEEIKSEYEKFKKIFGQLKDNNGMVLHANITIYQENTENIVSLVKTDDFGNYLLHILTGKYDVKFSFLDFSVSDYWVKFLSLNISSHLFNLLNQIGKTNNKISFNLNISNDQLIEIYSQSKPTNVMANGKKLTEVFSFYNLQPNTWFYDSSGKKLYLVVLIS